MTITINREASLWLVNYNGNSTFLLSLQDQLKRTDALTVKQWGAVERNYGWHLAAMEKARAEMAAAPRKYTRCLVCNRKLHDELSQRVGIGPTCRMRRPNLVAGS
jgi:hypothetical protein